MDEADGTFGIDELADAAGVSRRTVRFYVQRGLLPVPRGLGRGRHYGGEHLRTLRRIRALQEDGVPLALIARQLGPARQVERIESGFQSLEHPSPEGQAREAQPREELARGEQAQEEQAQEARAQDGLAGTQQDGTSASAATAWTHLELADGIVLQLRDRALDGATRRVLIAAVNRAVGLALGRGPGQPLGKTLDDSAEAQEEPG